MILAHGVGEVYELPIPLYLYLLAAAATVAASFLIRAFSTSTKPLAEERPLLGPGPARVSILVLRTGALVMLALTVVSGLVNTEAGISFTNLSFWVGLVIGTTILNALTAGAWEAADPWATIERFYRIEDAEVAERSLPWWVGPLGVFGLFWFELVSGVGFDPFWIVMVLIGYSLFSFLLRTPLGASWNLVDPLSILFGFAGRSAPFRLRPEGLTYAGPLAGLEEDRAMPRALFASVFILMASTTYDNLSETVGWFDFLRATNLDEAPDLIVDTAALALLALPFFASFMATMWIAGRSLGWSSSVGELGRRFGWALIPIGIAYVLAHNMPLLITGIPQIVRALSDPFGQGWNVLGTGDLWQGFAASPRLVWFLEIGIIVGGHVIGVLAAHRAAVRLVPVRHERSALERAAARRMALRSEYALTGLMSIYTVTTLWLLAQPLVA